MGLRIGFSRPTGKNKIFADLIMWWDRWRYASDVRMSHGYARFTSATWDRDFIYQAAGHQTHFMGGRLFETINVVIEEYELDLPPEVITRIGQMCVDREGKLYAVKQVCGQMLANMGYLCTFGRWEPENPFADGDAQVNCIEEMAVIIADALGILVPLNMDSSSVWPFRCWLALLPQVRRVR